MVCRGVYIGPIVSRCQQVKGMITNSLDLLIQKLGGAVALSRAMKEEGVTISHTSIVKWYSSKYVHPRKEEYKEAILKVADKNKMCVKLDA